MPQANRDVFINCPFDKQYIKFFRALVFVIIRSGFRPRCAKEEDNAAEGRIEKICKIISSCGYGVHDISRTSADKTTGLPRFNMPLELGLFLAANRFGRGRGKKCCAILDAEPYRYRDFISDISGQDIRAHRDRPNTLITEVAGWLRIQSRDQSVPGGKKIASEFAEFIEKLPAICKKLSLADDELTFFDLQALVIEYLR